MAEAMIAPQKNLIDAVSRKVLSTVGQRQATPTAIRKSPATVPPAHLATQSET